MNDLQLEYFITVAQSGSFSRGAEKLFVTTPAVSKQIAALEQEMGFKLFVRTGKGAELTTVGNMLLDYALNNRARFAKLMEDARNATAGQTKQFRLGIVESWMYGEALSAARRRLEAVDPDLELSVLPAHGRELLEWLVTGEADAIITIHDGRVNGQFQSSHYNMAHVAYIKRGFLFSSRSPLARKEHLRPQDFAGQPLYTMSNSTKVLAEEGNELICHSYGFSPEVRPMDNLRAIFHTISAGKGFTIVDEWNYARYTPDFCWLPLLEQHDVILCWTRDEDPAVQALVRLWTEEQPPGQH